MKKSNFRRMLSLYKPHKGLFCLVMFGVALQSVIDLVWPAMTRYILNNLLGTSLDEAWSELVICLWIMIGLTVLRVFTQWIFSERASVLTDCIKYNLQKKIFSKYLNMSFTYFDNDRAGHMITMLNYDIDKIDTFLYTFVSRVFIIVVTTIGLILLFSTISVKIMCMVMPMLIALIAFNKFHEKYLTKAFKIMRQKDKIRMEEAEDTIAGVRTVVSFGNEFAEKCKFSRLCNDAQEASKIAWRHNWIRNVSGDMFDDMYYITLLFIGGIMTLKGTLNLGDLTVFLMYSYMLTNPVKDMMNIMNMYSKANASFIHIAELLDEEPDIVSPKNHVRCDMSKGNIVFDHCTFKYGSSDETVLNDFSLTIESGKHTAIVGPSGSGKSTIAGLIPRYYDVKKGNITIGGVNVKDIDLTYMRSRIGVVQQDIYLFYGSIYDNIAYKNPHCSNEMVILAAKMANAHEFISKLPNGYNSNIGDRGVKLSGGQKQRIAIARVLLENPPIIIFDEATSALDNESEKEVQKAIDNIAGTRTVITIAHRLSTIKNADDIIFLSDNGIEERGSHDELMLRNGKYAELYRASEC